MSNPYLSLIPPISSDSYDIDHSCFRWCWTAVGMSQARSHFSWHSSNQKETPRRQKYFVILCICVRTPDQTDQTDQTVSQQINLVQTAIENNFQVSDSFT